METDKTLVMRDGATIHYRLSRDGLHPRGSIVLLHGMASNFTRWSEFLECTSLKADWNILRLDLRGHGESMVRGKIGMKVWSDDLVDLLDAERCERALLIGHSLGAHLALNFAARYPERTQALVLIDPVFPQALRGSMRWLRTARWLLAGVASLLGVLNALGIHRRRIARRDLRALDETVRRELLSAGSAKEFVSRYSSPLTDMKYIPVAHYLREVAEMFRPLPAPQEITVPALFLLSRGLTYTDPNVTARLLQEIPDATCETIDAYHWPLTERPEEIRHAIETWIDRRFPGR